MEAVNDFRVANPKAVHLSGYGNTLFGVVMEMTDVMRQNIDYFPLGERLEFHIVEWSPEEETTSAVPSFPGSAWERTACEALPREAPPVEMRGGASPASRSQAEFGNEDVELAWPPRCVERGQVGRVLFHRLDDSCLLIGVVERDEAERIAPSAEARALSGFADGLRNPRPPGTLAGRLQLGLY